MGRPERPIDPSSGPKEEFANELRKLRREAGNLSYRRMASRVPYSVTALSVAASGKALPSWEVTKAFVTACGADPDDWVERWSTAEQGARHEAMPCTAEGGEGGDPPVGAARSGVEMTATRGPARRYPKRLLWIIPVVVALAVGWTLAAELTPASPDTAGRHSTFLGFVDLSRYCRSEGYVGAQVEGSTVYDWRCTRSHGDTGGISVTEACRWQYRDPTAIAHYGDFYTPGSWQCWGNVVDLGQVDVTGYCQAQGYLKAVLGGTTTNTWRCASATGSSTPVDPDSVCRWQYGAAALVADISNFHAPYNFWNCWG